MRKLMKSMTSGVLVAVGAAAAGVQGASAQSILLDVGLRDTQAAGSETQSPDARGNTWNNFGQGQFLPDLLDTTGATTGIGFGATTGLPTGANGGLTNPDPFFLGDFAVATATQDYIFVNPADVEPVVLQFSGLDQALEYNFRFFGSRTSTETRETSYTAVGGNGSFEATLITSGTNIGSDGASFGNDNVIAEVTNVSPRLNGTIDIELRVAQGAFGYLNAMEVQLVAPVSFTSQPTSAVVDAGGTLVFAASVESGATFDLQWERDGAPLVDDGRIMGATTNTLTIDQASLADVGEYRLVASVGAATASSAPAVAAVRQATNDLDVNNDGTVDVFDAIDLISAIDIP